MDTNPFTHPELVELLKPLQVSKILNLSKQQVYKMIQQRKIPSIHIGKSVRVRKCDLQEYIEKAWTGWE